MSANLSPVLIVDDEKDNLEALQRLLRSHFAITTTVSPLEALKMIQNGEFHVIVSDQRMPEMTGVELLEKVKKLKPETTRILLTGYTDIASVIDAINRGNIYRYIAKPWDPDDFRITLRQAADAYLMRKELEQKNIELSKAVEDLKVLDRAKSRFLSLVSHELNTPLTVLSSFVGLLTEEKSLSPEIKKYVGSIHEASNRFSEIVSEVLTYLKYTSGTPITKEELDVVPVINQALDNFKKQLEKKNIKLKKPAEKSLKHLIDVNHFKTLVEKLIADAIVRTLPNSEIGLEITKKNGALVFSIDRSGEAVEANAFQPLEASSNPMHHQKNLGLSLATAKLIVDSNLGSLSVSSQGKQQKIEAILP